jgi:glucose-6-phosphate 1-epimerase
MNQKEKKQLSFWGFFKSMKPPSPINPSIIGFMSTNNPTPFSSAVTPGMNQLPKVILEGPNGARAEIYEHGGQVTSWIPAGGEERLFLSSASDFHTSATIRGGIPVIFPQFGSFGPMSKHGFARHMDWELLGAEKADPESGISRAFRLRDDEAARKTWPHAFECTMAVTLGAKQLDTRLSVVNTGPEPFTFTGALHTYLRVADIRSTVIEGLGGLPYTDTVGGLTPRIQEAAELSFQAETDRIFYQAPRRLVLREPSRELVVEMTGFEDAVIWNPWSELGSTLKDLEPDGYLRFVCIEAAQIGHPVTLDPGESWRGSQTLKA